MCKYICKYRYTQWHTYCISTYHFILYSNWKRKAQPLPVAFAVISVRQNCTKGKDELMFDLAPEKPAPCEIRNAIYWAQTIESHSPLCLSLLPRTVGTYTGTLQLFPFEPHLHDLKGVHRSWKWKCCYTNCWGGNRHWEKLKQVICQALQWQFHRVCAFQMLFIY